MDFLELCSLMRTFYDDELVKTIVFHFSIKQQLNICVVSAISSTAATSAAKASLASSASTGVLVAVVVTAPSASVCLRHDNVSFVLYKSMQ